MAFKYKDRTAIDIGGRFVFDLIEDEDERRSPVSVRATADVVKQKSGIAWGSEKAVREWFDSEKGKHLEVAEKLAPLNYDENRVGEYWIQ